MNNSSWKTTSIGEITTESKTSARDNSNFMLRDVYGVDRNIGLTPVAKYTAKSTERYKIIEPGWFAYNPMRINIGSIGFCKVEMSPGLVSPDYVVFKCHESQVDPEFLSYYIKSPSWKKWTSKSGVGSVRTRIYYKELAIQKLLLPPLPEQRAIAEVLSALDNKIELNRCMNHNLNELAKSLFRHWFIDNSHLEAREEKSLDEIANFLNGLALQKYPPRGDEFLPVIKIAQLRTGNTENADKASIDLDPAYVVNDGDVLFSWSGSLDVVFWCGGIGALNQHLFKVTSTTYPKWFYYYWIKNHLQNFQSIAAGKATTMGHIQRHHLTEAKVIIPDKPELIVMNEIMEPIIEKMIVNNIESRTLAELRDTLLPKLMSGQIKVLRHEY